MKPAQWVIAAALLLSMVFVLTFAMNYLQKPQASNHTSSQPTSGRDHELTFLTSKVLPGGGGYIESELKQNSYQDFWFVNGNDAAIPVGLGRKGCRCSQVVVTLVPTGGVTFPIAVASGVGVAAAGPLAATVGQAAALAAVQNQSGLESAELLQRAESINVPPGRTGWVRLHWKGEKAGAQTLEAILWLHSKESGRIATLEVAAIHYEPLRLRRSLAMGVLSDDQLNSKEGVRRHIKVWSSTRHDFKLEAKLVARRDSATDPFRLEPIEPMTTEELRALEKENNSIMDEREAVAVAGRVLSGYKIPFTVRGMAPDGKTPIDIGPYRRAIQIISPDAGTEPIVAIVQGRVRGVVELGSDDDGSGMEFGRFPSRTGAKTKLSVFSNVPGLKLVFDQERTPKYLTATVTGPQPASEVDTTRMEWSIQAKVLPEKVSGLFPRAEDPLYEDSAVYLKAYLPGKPEPRSVRIPARGTADQR